MLDVLLLIERMLLHIVAGVVAVAIVAFVVTLLFLLGLMALDLLRELFAKPKCCKGEKCDC